jgi:hypothetical protein
MGIEKCMSSEMLLALTEMAHLWHHVTHEHKQQVFTLGVAFQSLLQDCKLLRRHACLTALLACTLMRLPWKRLHKQTNFFGGLDKALAVVQRRDACVRASTITAL